MSTLTSKSLYRQLTLDEMYSQFGRKRVICPVCGRVASTCRNRYPDSEKIGVLYVHKALTTKTSGSIFIEIVDSCQKKESSINGIDTKTT